MLSADLQDETSADLDDETPKEECHSNHSEWGVCMVQHVLQKLDRFVRNFEAGPGGGEGGKGHGVTDGEGDEE